MKKKFLFALTPVLLLSQVINAGIIEPHVIWDKKELKTCFFSENDQLALTRLQTKQNTKDYFDFSPKSLTKRKRENVRNIILNEYTEARTGIHFTGFKDCSEVSDPDVIVMRAAAKIFLLDMPEFRGRAVIGEDGFFQIESDNEGNFVLQKDGTYNEGFFNKSGKTAFVALRTMNAGTIVHEFGHVAGLRHEHIRAEAEQDRNCHKSRVNWPTEEKIYDSAQIETNYDHLSIMNYCYLQSYKTDFSDRIGTILSEGDTQTLRAYY